MHRLEFFCYIVALLQKKIHCIMVLASVLVSRKWQMSNINSYVGKLNRMQWTRHQVMYNKHREGTTLYSTVQVRRQKQNFGPTSSKNDTFWLSTTTSKNREHYTNLLASASFGSYKHKVSTIWECKIWPSALIWSHKKISSRFEACSNTFNKSETEEQQHSVN